MIYWSNQHYAGQCLVLSDREREKCVRACVSVCAWRLHGVAWSIEKGRHILGWEPKGKARFELCSRAITEILPLIRLALNNTLTDMTNRCIRACHSFLISFLSSFSLILFAPFEHFPFKCPTHTHSWSPTSRQMCNLTILPMWGGSEVKNGK